MSIRFPAAEAKVTAYEHWNPGGESLGGASQMGTSSVTKVVSLDSTILPTISPRLDSDDLSEPDATASHGLTRKGVGG